MKYTGKKVEIRSVIYTTSYFLNKNCTTARILIEILTGLFIFITYRLTAIGECIVQFAFANAEFLVGRKVKCKREEKRDSSWIVYAYYDQKVVSSKFNFVKLIKSFVTLENFTFKEKRFNSEFNSSKRTNKSLKLLSQQSCHPQKMIIRDIYILKSNYHIFSRILIHHGESSRDICETDTRTTNYGAGSQETMKFCLCKYAINQVQ